MDEQSLSGTESGEVNLCHTQPASVPYTRPMYIKRVPEEIWLLTHANANRSRLSLQEYVVRLLCDCVPFDPTDPPAFA